MYAVLVESGSRVWPSAKECYMVGGAPSGVCWEGGAPWAAGMCKPGGIPHLWP